MVIMGTLIVDPVPPIAMTHGITASGVIGVMWKMTKDIVTPSGQMWGKELSLPDVHRDGRRCCSGGCGYVLRGSCEITGFRRARPF